MGLLDLRDRFLTGPNATGRAMNGTPKGTLEELEGGDKWTESPDDTFPIIALCRLAPKAAR